MKFDEITTHLGQFGKYQKRLYFILCLPAISCGIQMFGSVFILAVPNHRCAVETLSNDTYSVEGRSHDAAVNASIPYTFEDDERLYTDCSHYSTTNATLFNEFGIPEDSPTHTCNKWVYDKSVFEETLISEMNLVCGDRIARSHANMILFGGLLVGALGFGLISDLIGRKKAMMISIVLHCASSIAQPFSPNYAALVSLRFITGASTVGLFLLAFVIGIEFIGPQKRIWAGVVIEFFWCIGLFLDILAAYFFRDWRMLQLVVSVPTVLFLSYFWLVPESARWLLAKGKNEEAEKIIRHIGKVNSVTLPEKIIDKNTGTENRDSSILKMFTSPVLVVRTLVIYFNWCVVSMVYYGLMLNVGSLGGDIYVNSVISAAMEVIAYALCLLLLDRMGRKKLHSLSMILGGVACLCTIFTVLYGGEEKEWTTILLSNIGKLGSSIAFAVIYVYSAELFPTVVRNSGLGSSSMCARIGGMVSPYIADLGTLVEGPTSKALPLIIFGGLSIAAGLLALILPETVNRKLPETIEDALMFGRQNSDNKYYVNKAYDDDEEYSTSGVAKQQSYKKGDYSDTIFNSEKL
ncbi:hypothetical protein ScPMuIL_013436 [Solemya velum]